jgi:competence protein ComGC
LLYLQKEKDTAMSIIVRLVFCLIILLFVENVSAQESQSIRATAHVINNEVVKTWAEASPLNINGTEIYEVTVLKQGNGDIQLNITAANGKTEEQTIESNNGYLYHKMLIEAGRKAIKEESAVSDTSSTLVTIIYIDI